MLSRIYIVRRCEKASKFSDKYRHFKIYDKTENKKHNKYLRRDAFLPESNLIKIKKKM